MDSIEKLFGNGVSESRIVANVIRLATKVQSEKAHKNDSFDDCVNVTVTRLTEKDRPTSNTVI